MSIAKHRRAGSQLRIAGHVHQALVVHLEYRHRLTFGYPRATTTKIGRDDCRDRARSGVVHDILPEVGRSILHTTGCVLHPDAPDGRDDEPDRRIGIGATLYRRPRAGVSGCRAADHVDRESGGISFVG